MRRLALLLFLWTAPVWAQPPQQPPPTPEPPLAPAIRLPDIAAPIPPKPPPDPSVVPTLTGGTYYIIDSDVQCFVLASPAGLVTVAEDQGPLRLRGVFIDGNGRTQTRTYKGKYIYSVEAAPGAKGRAELLVVPAGVTKAADIIRRTVDVDGGQGPQPPPAPVPPGPTPPPPDAFQAALQAAYALEPAPDKANQVKVLAGFYRAAALTTVRNPALATLGDLQDTLKLAVKQIGLPAGALAKLVPVIAADEIRALGTNRGQPLDQTTRDAAASEFVRVAASLEGLVAK
jgi:hypothetical protein